MLDPDFSFDADVLPEEIPAELARLIGILRLRRTDGGKAEALMIDKLIKTLPHVKVDKAGNYAVRIPKADGTASRVLWSCHTDTVHRTDGVQSLTYCKDNGVINVSDGECLGADDGAGLWLLLEMIDAKVPGLYVFHRNEEHGCVGSRYRAANLAHTLTNIKYAVAFDRKGTTSVITHQYGRTCSDAFAKSMIGMLDMEHRLDPTGMFTDTKSYAEIIPECTNISIGYENAHSANEYLDTTYLLALRDSILTNFDEDLLVCERDPKSFKPEKPVKKIKYKYEPRYMERLIRCNADLVTDLLESWGWDGPSLLDTLEASGKAVIVPRDLPGYYAQG